MVVVAVSPEQITRIIVERFHPRRMDLVVYTPQEVARLQGQPGTLLSVIEAEGRTLYEHP